MERLGRWLYSRKRKLAGFMAVVLVISTIGIPVPVMGSEIWPQKSTAPYYCLDGGKGWKASDRYEIYQYDTLPSALTETQAKRLFWAYPTNWEALKAAAQTYDPELYREIASTVSSANIVKRVKDDAGTKFAWIADHAEIEQRAIAALEKVSAENAEEGNEAPEAIRDATSEETAVEFVVPTLSDGPGGLNTEFKLSSAFIRDIATIEAQSVWDNGSTGGNVGWLDASQDKNIAKAVLGEELYELTWSGDSIKIRNNGSVVEAENVLNKDMSEEEKLNKTTVRYKITMRENSGWYTDGTWNDNYLKEWMDFKACVNAPGHQRLYKADIRIVPSDMVFYLVISQKPYEEIQPKPENKTGGTSSAEVEFQIYRHEEKFETNYNVKLKKVDDETGNPLKGSQFYLYERFEDGNCLADDETEGGIIAENLNFLPWKGFQIFAEGTTNDAGEILHTDTRSYMYSKTYCDGHEAPDWAEVTEDKSEDSEGEIQKVEEEADGGSEEKDDSKSEESKDQNRKAAKEWLALYENCEEAEQTSEGTHFHWVVDEGLYDQILEIAESGDPKDFETVGGADKEEAFEKSGCKDDCEATYKTFRELRFTYTWKEVQARTGYILHGVHEDDIPVHFVTTESSEAGARSVVCEGNSSDLANNIWYAGGNQTGTNTDKFASNVRTVSQEKTSGFHLIWDEAAQISQCDIVAVTKKSKTLSEDVIASNVIASASNTTDTNAQENATSSNATATSSNAEKGFLSSVKMWFSQFRVGTVSSETEDSEWEELDGDSDFDAYLEAAEDDEIRHLGEGKSDCLSYAGDGADERSYWQVRDHRTEGEIHINKRDMDLYKGESELYSSYGDTEGDAVLEGALYGLFAAEDIIHPDSDVLADGTLTNTGVVYQKNELVSIAEIDRDGNASFYTYTEEPQKAMPYESFWIGRPLILGNYYVKELERSEGYELSINGKNGEWTNYGSDSETPDSIVSANGTAVLTMPELSAMMEGEDENGAGYNKLSFSITSTGTTDSIIGTTGYSILASGFPDGTIFYRVDSGNMEVTGPHVTGMEEVPVRDENGDIVWKTAESEKSHVKYEPEYSEDGAIIGQIPISQMEAQVQKLEQVSLQENQNIEIVEVDLSDIRWMKKIQDQDFSRDSSEFFGMVKAELEHILSENGYDVPVTADGTMSEEEHPVFSVGVVKGQTDEYGMTTRAGEMAVKTVYGAALQEIQIENVDENTTILDLLYTILEWYQEHAHWNFGGIHEILIKEDSCVVTVYAGVSRTGIRSFFTMYQDALTTPQSVFVVLENPETLRWEYQEYRADGAFQYQIDRQYYLGGSGNKRYYLDVSVAPAVMIDRNGNRQVLEHQVMEYHQEGEIVVDYLSGDPEHGYQVPMTEVIERMEITTELEHIELDVPLECAKYDSKTGQYTIFVETEGTDAFGVPFTDDGQSLTLTFMAELPANKTVLSEEDINVIGNANVYGYQSGDEIGYAEYLMRFADASLSVTTGVDAGNSDTFIVTKQLIYRGQHKVREDGDTYGNPVQVLERPIKQKIRVVKEIEEEEAIPNFRFKLYLKSNLERLYCDEDGTICWQDRDGMEIDIKSYKEVFPELVQKIYTEKTDRQILERIKRTIIDADGGSTKIDTYNYEKFFDAIRVANTDKWHNDETFWNTSWKMFTKNLLSGMENTINSSVAAKENAKRSDAVRQFAADWYLDDEVEALLKDLTEVSYTDEVYDRALHQAILCAEDYLEPFFKYDLDSIYEIFWDSELDGGVDLDGTTLAADVMEDDLVSACGVSNYLPYGTYVLVEQQPYCADWNDLKNRHYEIDTPKELSLPQYDEDGIRIAPKEVPWTMTEPGEKDEMSGYAGQNIKNERYKAVLRIEKQDAETGEPILHDDAIFALYRAECDDGDYGTGAVKRYQEDTIISGSKLFLEAMGAENITSFARIGSDYPLGVGVLYTGIVSKGTPICSEEDSVVFRDSEGSKQGVYRDLSTANDNTEEGVFQTLGYVETPEPVDAGAYVLAEIKPPAGYVRSKPLAVEVYSDRVLYDSEAETGAETRTTAAITFGNYLGKDGTLTEKEMETARIYVNDTATTLEISKIKTEDTYRGMKISGRVEGTLTELKECYGLENLELAYNSSGKYLGFGWKKGTLEYLENRKEAGERIQVVYDNGIFQGYGYVTRNLETALAESRYVAGAQLALYEAIELERNGNNEDFAFSGVEVIRDRNGNVISVYVKKEFAGKGEDTPILYYDLGGLEVLDRDSAGNLYAYDKNGQQIQITFETNSIYALKDGQPVFELTGGNFHEIKYDEKAKAFTQIGEYTQIYHLDQEKCRDAMVDGYTGIAYVEKIKINKLGKKDYHYYVWPVTELRNDNGIVIERNKILTGRPGEKNSGLENAYITGSVQSDTGEFEKVLKPYFTEQGLVDSYPSSDLLYEKGEEVYDRDGKYAGYQYDDLLEEYNRAAYRISEEPELYSTEPLSHREGEAWMIPNVWLSGTEFPQDPSDSSLTSGKSDVLRRVVTGTYILEELKAPDGYVRAMPTPVIVEETLEVQRVSVTNEKTKVEIAKIDGTENYKKLIRSNLVSDYPEYGVEGNGAYSNTFISGAELALYKAKKVYTSDYQRYPKGYYLVKMETEPAHWYTEDLETNQPVLVEARWITTNQPKYFEGIPVGDYILEELQTPAGYLPATKEITVQATEDLQSFFLMDDHTKLEIFKYEMVNGEKQPLEWPAQTELTLYPALYDASGELVTVDGQYLYDDQKSYMTWKTGDLEMYQAICDSYEALYEDYQDTFEQFGYSVYHDGVWKHGKAHLGESKRTGNGEIVTQMWNLDDGSVLRITANKNDGAAQTNADGKRNVTFEYQFEYQEIEKGADVVNYNMRNGIHRIDRIPSGDYILVETKVPTGYQPITPILVQVQDMEEIQRVYVENIRKEEESKGQLIIEKRDFYDTEKSLTGAWFEIKNLQSGEYYRVVTGEDGRAVLSNLPVFGIYESGEKGPCIYEVRELTAPSGYQREDVVWKFRFRNVTMGETAVHTLCVENKQTEFTFSKRDFQTGHFATGAELAVYEAQLNDGVFMCVGDPLERWISQEEPHRIIGKLSGGKTYFLVEESAPEGYYVEKPLRFTISADGKTITNLSSDMAQVQIKYHDKNSTVEAISVIGRTAESTEYQLYHEDDVAVSCYGIGEIIEWKTMESNGKKVGKQYLEEVLTSEEQVWFSDGSSEILQRETFRIEDGSRMQYTNSGHYPVYTEYLMTDSDGVRIDKWILNRETENGMVHEIVNYKTSGEKWCFEAGESYCLTETVVFNDGNRVETNQFIIHIPMEESAADIELMNRKTEVRIKKVDLTTGKELPGATLILKNSKGEILEEWISGEEEYVIKYALQPGESYRLEECLAVDGYAYAEEITFRIHENGTVDKIVMEDRPTCVEIRKSDFTTGEELPGAKLTLKDITGEVIEQWITSHEPHIIRGRLIAGAAYRLSEEIAPDGYLIAEEIVFEVAMDGTINKVEMKDKRKVIKVEEDEEEPEDSDVPEKPEKVEEIIIPEKSKKKGSMEASYTANKARRGRIRLITPDEFEYIIVPETGEKPNIGFALIGIVLSMTGLGVLEIERRKHERNIQQREESVQNEENRPFVQATAENSIDFGSNHGL